MPIPVECRSCGHRLKAKDASAGRKIRCPECEEPISVPSGGPRRKKAAKKKRPEPEEFDENADLDFGALANMERRGDSLGMGDVEACPECGEPVGRLAEECPHCEADLVEIKQEQKKQARIAKRKALMEETTGGGLSGTAVKIVLLVVIAVIGNFALYAFTGNAAIPIPAAPDEFREALVMPIELFEIPDQVTDEEREAIDNFLKQNTAAYVTMTGSGEFIIVGPSADKGAVKTALKAAMDGNQIKSIPLD